MKPLFTIHGGEFLVGDYITKEFGRKFDVWVPTKDRGVDLLVTDKRRHGRAVGLQVKFSRDFGVRDKSIEKQRARGWFKLDTKKVRESEAELWIFAILTLKHEKHFVVIPTRELRRRIPRRVGGTWHLYLAVFDNGSNGSCYQVRGIGREERLNIVNRGVRERHRNFSEWLENWNLLDGATSNAR